MSILNSYSTSSLRTVKFLLLASIVGVLPTLSHAFDMHSSKKKLDKPDPYTISSTFSAQKPHDIDVGLQQSLLSTSDTAKVQRLFDIFAWESFIALNWPLNANGQAQPKLSASGLVEWEGWKESYEVFKPDGSAPSVWGVQEYPEHFTLSTDSAKKAGGVEKVLFRSNKLADLTSANVDDEISQAFSSPIWDQNGNIVRYEVLMNKTEFDYIKSNKLYNIDGQIAFHQSGKTVDFPASTVSGTSIVPGVMELKLAWKVIDAKKDIPSRFFVRDSFVYNEDGTYSKEQVGLVGMHISVKTKSAPQWVWATFEHVDNLQVNDLVKVGDKSLKPLFFNPECALCPVNVYPLLPNDYAQSPVVKRNQIKRVIPIPKATQALNTTVQELLSLQKSVLQYYQLVGVQWPTEPSAKPYPVTSHSGLNPPSLPEAVTNKSGGKPHPTYLTNMVMETYLQGASLGGSEITTNSFNNPMVNAKAWHQIQGFKQYGLNNKRVFGTESCMGCHYSASIATGEIMSNGQRTAQYGAPGAADFSWLLQLKARFKTDVK